MSQVSCATLSDRDLLQRFVSGRDEAAFELIVRRHGPLVLGLCRRVLGDAQDAEDVFQATFLLLARNAEALRKPDSLGSWLYGVAYRVALRQRTRAQRRRYHERQAAATIRQETAAEPSWGELRGALDEELNRLPEKWRAPLVLCYLEGLTQDEAARQLGWPRGTLKRRLESGRGRLRDRLTRRGLGLSAVLLPILLDRSGPPDLPFHLLDATARSATAFAVTALAFPSPGPTSLGSLARHALRVLRKARAATAVALVVAGSLAAAAAFGSQPAPAPAATHPEPEAVYPDGESDYHADAPLEI